MELSGHQIRDRHFASAIRGYSRTEVDTFCAEIANHVGVLEQRLRNAEVRAAHSSEKLAELRSKADSVLAEAIEARRTIIEEAKVEAAVIAYQSTDFGAAVELVDTAAKTTSLMSQADRATTLSIERAELHREAANEKARQVLRRAEESASLTQAEADRVLDKARIDARLMRRESIAVQTKADTHLAEIQRILLEVRRGGVELDDLAHSSIIDLTGSDAAIDLREGASKRHPQQSPR